jgi:hypothetical protein
MEGCSLGWWESCWVEEGGVYTSPPSVYQLLVFTIVLHESAAYGSAN